MPKFVFVSYAHTNGDEYLKRFVRDLEGHVLAHLAGVQPKDVVFFDIERIAHGECWSDRLAHELAGCKACVAICSPAFAASAFCGKELRVFLDRVGQWMVERAADAAESPMFPVVWVPSDVPPVLAPYQRKGAGYGDDYAQGGLRRMYALAKYRQARTDLVLSLAEQIAKAARKADLQTRVGVPHFDNIVSAFQAHDAAVRHGVAVYPLLRQHALSVPFGDGRSVASIVEAACGAGVPHRYLDAGHGLADRLVASRAGREVALVVTDVPTLGDPLFQQEIAAVNGALAAPAVIVVLRDPAPGDAPAEEHVKLTVHAAFDRAVRAGAEVDFTTARSTKATEDLIVRRVLALRKALIEQQAPAAVQDQALTDAAAARGVPVDEQPIVTGHEVKAA